MKTVENIDFGFNNDAAFRFTCLYGKTDIVEFLLKLDIVDPANLNNIDLLNAVENKHFSVIKLLIKDDNIDQLVEILVLFKKQFH